MNTSQSSGAVEAFTGIFNSVNKAANNAVNTIAKNVPFFDSLVPLGNTSSGAANSTTTTTPKAANNTKPAGNNTKAANTYGNVFGNNIFGNNSASPSPTTGKGSIWPSIPIVSPVVLFAVFIVILMGVLLVFRRQIHSGYEYVAENTKRVLGFRTHPEVTAAIYPEMHDPTANVTVPPVAPQTVTPAQERLPQPTQTSIVEKILPSTKNEVFNVAQNKFTYYDAEPLCNALGAELATYEQVKNAWENGADWCNYGWVKGQMAVYPTQQGTYDRLQAGPEGERNSCGTTGLNGGYFENPDFKYGVNCYGKKPNQSAHDQKQLMEEGKYPRSPETLKVDALVREFKSEADSLFVKPFNDEKWASTT